MNQGRKIAPQALHAAGSLGQGSGVRRSWSLRSVAILTLAWVVLQFGGIFSPGLLDDVDSIYIEIAREMLHRHDYVTPYIDGVRFFDKPPLMYWMAAGSMRLFGEFDWAARIPLTLAVLALSLSVYALGIRLFSAVSPARTPDRGGLYAALAVATSIGPYLFTRFYIPDILLCLWMTLGVHLTLLAVDRLDSQRSALLPCLGFAAVLALNVLTKGLIGLVFPLGFVLLYFGWKKRLKLLLRLHLLASTGVFLAIAAPWHILAALRTPAIALPAGLGLPAKGGWAWFYLYNEHVARFLAKRIPHDYGQVPVPLFWLMLLLWVMPWSTFLPAAVRSCLNTVLQDGRPNAGRAPLRGVLGFAWGSRWSQTIVDADQREEVRSFSHHDQHEAAVALLVWTAIVMGFFTLSSRQEYYSLPAIPALCLMVGGFLASAEAAEQDNVTTPSGERARRSSLRWCGWILLPVTMLIAGVCGYFALSARAPVSGMDGRVPDLATLLSNNPDLYNLSLGHLYDLTGAAMGLFRGPLAVVALSMIAIGPIAYGLRRSRRSFAANLTLAGGMTVALLAAHEGLVRFNPILGSKSLALSIVETQHAAPAAATRPDLIVLDGELTSGSTLIFYTRQQVHLVNGRVNGLWYGSFWPDAPAIFETEDSLHAVWASSRRVFLFTYNPAERARDLAPYATVRTLAAAGGKSILTNR